MTIVSPFAPDPTVFRGACPVCGYEGITPLGKVGRHFQMRVKVGPFGVPMEYATKLVCAGTGERSEPLSPTTEDPGFRVCANDQCRRSFTARTPHMKYCRRSCQDQVSRRKAAARAAQAEAAA